MRIGKQGGNYDYHYWYRTNDGPWANKHGQTPSVLLPASDMPTTNSSSGWTLNGKTAGTAKVWAAALFLGIVCSGVCLVIQSVYQKHTTASRASLIFTLEPVFSAIFAFFLLGERIGVKGYIGSALMLASLVLVEVDVGALFGKNKKKAD